MGTCADVRVKIIESNINTTFVRQKKERKQTLIARVRQFSFKFSNEKSFYLLGHQLSRSRIRIKVWAPWQPICPKTLC